MNITEELLQLFEKQKSTSYDSKRAIVFWYDPQGGERDLTEVKESLAEQGIKWWTLTKYNAFQTKVMLEMEDKESSYLLYAPYEKPKDEDNFLLDILLYAGEYGEFQADEIAILMKQLQIDHLAIRFFLEEHWSFFKNQQRIEKFKRLLPNQPTAEQVKQTMLAVLCKAKSIHPQELLKRVLVDGDLSDSNEKLSEVAKFMKVEEFFETIESYFGIEKREENRLAHIIETIVFQHFASTVDEKILEERWTSTVPNICKVFIDDWFKSDDSPILEEIANQLEEKWNVRNLIQNYTYEPFIRCDTFAIIDQTILHVLHELLVNETIPIKEWKTIIAERKKGYWYNVKYQEEYTFLHQVLSMYEWKERFERENKPQDAKEWFDQYTQSYFNVDQLYRHIQMSYSRLPHDQYEDLMKQITFWYENKFLSYWASVTDEVVSENLHEKWSIPEVMQQKNFYSHFIRPIMEGTKERVFVLISDALRYEIGAELADQFKSRLNTEIQLLPMQAVIPSYTQLGMAALLPGKITKIDEDGTVYIQDISTKGLTNRNRILQMQEPDSIALKLEDFIRLSKKEGFEYIRGKRVVYLYHDAIDAIGDSNKTESYTFEAVNSAIDHIQSAIQKLAGTYEASRVFITSDHGFLYQSQHVESYQKTEKLLGKVFDGNRRFSIGENLTSPEGTQKVSLSYLGLDYEAVIAKGLNRFTGHGGLRFVHGGATPQEIIVPLIEFRQTKGKARKTKEERVDVSVASVQKIITNYQFMVPFFQEDKVSNDLFPRTLRAAFYKGNERISNEVIITFDSTKDVLDRQQEVVFHLFEGSYKTGETCTLRLEDVSGKTTELYREEEYEIHLYSV